MLLLHMLGVSGVRYPARYRAQPDTGYPAKHIQYPAGYRISKNGRISGYPDIRHIPNEKGSVVLYLYYGYVLSETSRLFKNAYSI